MVIILIDELDTLFFFSFRYSVCRKQFGPVEGGPETPVIEYQMPVVNSSSYH